jgi:hypothetical protein
VRHGGAPTSRGPVMPHLIIFLALCLLGLMVSCVLI